MRLLLVEDTERLRELLTDAVHGAGWRIDAFGCLADAQEAIATSTYDLLLIDLGMPDGDGIDLIRAIRRDGVKTPVLVLTARGAIDDRIVGLDAGADDYLVKPFNHREFLARCRALLRRAPATMSVLQAPLGANGGKRERCSAPFFLPSFLLLSITLFLLLILLFFHNLLLFFSI